MINVKVYSKDVFESTTLVNDITVKDSPDYFICVNSSGYIHSIPYFKDSHQNVLNCFFDDVNSDQAKFDVIFNIEFSAKACTQDQALEIKNFVDNIPDNSTLHIYCAKGKSRSTAIAKFVHEYKNKIDSDITQYNDHVYNLLCSISK